MNFAHSSSVAARSLSSCLSFSVKSSTGFLARLSVASITFFCCLRNSWSLSFRSLSLSLTLVGSSVSGRFFISARSVGGFLADLVQQPAQDVDDLVLRGQQLCDRLGQLAGGMNLLGRLGLADGLDHLAQGKLADHALDREPVGIVGRADRGDDVGRGLLNGHLLAADVAGNLGCLGLDLEPGQLGGGGPGAELVLKDLRQRCADLFKLGHVCLGLRLRRHDVYLLPGRGRFLRLELQFRQVKLTAVPRHGADPYGLARLE